MDEDELRDRELEGYLALAQEYLEDAESSIAEERYRVAVDTAYNAAESCARGLLRLKLLELPLPHRGLIAKFSELYVKDGTLPRKLGRTLNAMLELRGRARYDANARMSKSEAEDAIRLAEALMKAFEDQLPSD
jgi:uncharacterized protein (UPF0332 family)